jgi:glycosyltransferase involved in cell wall biosynthesis
VKFKVIYVVNNPDFLISHRLEVCLKANNLGYSVNIICPYKPSVKKLEDLDFTVHLLEFGRDRKNPLFELKTIFQLTNLFKIIKPDLVHLITIKPYLYGGISAKLAKVPAVVSAVAGLGTLFSSKSYKHRILRFCLYPLFKLAFVHNNQSVIFQNLDDRAALVAWRVVSESKVKMVRGSGVDLKSCPVIEESNSIPVVSFAARLLKDKGVEVFVDASAILKQRGVKARFWLIGEPDLGNTNSVTQSQLDSWAANGLVELFGFRKDIPQLFSQSNIVTLPSFYGEGLPKVLIEAAACSRPVITTDHPGCRDAVDADVTGVLVPIKDPEALADAINDLIENSDKRRSMGQAGRKLAEEVFDVNRVVDQHFDIYNELLSKVNIKVY